MEHAGPADTPDREPILSYVDPPTPDGAWATTDDTQVHSHPKKKKGKMGKGVRRTASRIDNKWMVEPGTRGPRPTSPTTAKMLAEVQGAEILTKGMMRQAKSHTPAMPQYGPPLGAQPRRRFRNEKEMAQSVERLHRSAMTVRLDTYMDMHGKTAGFRKRPMSAAPGAKARRATAGAERPSTAPAGGQRFMQAGGQLFPYGGEEKKISTEELDKMVQRLYVVRQPPLPPDTPVGWTRYKLEDGRMKPYFHPAPKLSEKEYTARLVEFDKRCKELEAKTRAKLERKWLGPLCKPKLYRGQDGEAERESRTNRLFKGESTLQKEEVRRAIHQQRKTWAEGK